MSIANRDLILPQASRFTVSKASVRFFIVSRYVHLHNSSGAGVNEPRQKNHHHVC
jgi:hypothetical protein